MVWKIFLIISLSLLMFALGFFFGGVHWAWMAPGHADTIAFWSMLGGWVSGLATLAAVAISLMVAYHASRNNAEKLEVSVGRLVIRQDLDDVRVYITVQSLRNIRAEVVDIRLIIKKKTNSVSLLVVLTSLRPLPNILEHIGENITYSIKYSISPLWGGIYDAINQQGGVEYRKTKIQVLTTMGEYTCILPRDSIIALKTKHNKYNEINVPVGNVA